MYRLIVARRARAIFAALSEKDPDAVLKDARDDVHHVFPGDNALGGERHSKAAMSRWLERVFFLLPEIEFDVKKVAVRGWPWNTIVLIEWSDRGKARDGVPYENEGMHAIRLRWGKATYIHAYLDTEKVTAVCDRLAASGTDEAAAPPITS